MDAVNWELMTDKRDAVSALKSQNENKQQYSKYERHVVLSRTAWRAPNLPFTRPIDHIDALIVVIRVSVARPSDGHYGLIPPFVIRLI